MDYDQNGFNSLGLNRRMIKRGSLEDRPKSLTGQQINEMIRNREIDRGAFTQYMVQAQPFFAEASGTNAIVSGTISGTAVTPLTGGTLGFTLARPTLFRYDQTVCFLMQSSDNGCHVFPTIDGTIPLGGAGKYFSAIAPGNTTMRSYTAFHVETLQPGTHTVVINANLTDDTGLGSAIIVRWKYAYTLYGK